MEISKYVCDYCHKETTDRYAEIGWIRIAGAGALSATISKGRKSDGTADTEYYQRSGARNNTLDFCHTGCLLAFCEALCGRVRLENYIGGTPKTQDQDIDIAGTRIKISLPCKPKRPQPDFVKEGKRRKK